MFNFRNFLIGTRIHKNYYGKPTSNSSVKMLIKRNFARQNYIFCSFIWRTQIGPLFQEIKAFTFWDLGHPVLLSDEYHRCPL